LDISIAALAGGAFGSLAANLGLERLAKRLGWYDPPGKLKIHTKPVALTGGAGVLVGLLLVLAVLAIAGFAGSTVRAIAAASTLAFVLGFWDDRRWKLSSVAGPKLVLQAAAAAAMALALHFAGVRPALPTFVALGLGAGYFVCAMNALNLEDGMDGLAAGEAAISCLGFAWVLAGTGRLDCALLGLGGAAALAGFLVMNWHPAKVFLGDAGSHLAGALAAGLALAVIGAVGPRAIPATVLIVGLPVVGTAWVIVRRLSKWAGSVLREKQFLRREAKGEWRIWHRVGAGDREHLYDIVHSSGVSTRRTVLLFWLVQAVMAAAGVLWLERMR